MDSIIKTLINTLHLIPELIIVIALFFLIQKYKHLSLWLMLIGTVLRIIGSLLQFNINIQSMELEGTNFSEIEMYFRVLQFAFISANFLFAIGLLLFALYFAKNKQNPHL